MDSFDEELADLKRMYHRVFERIEKNPFFLAYYKCVTTLQGFIPVANCDLLKDFSEEMKSYNTDRLYLLMNAYITFENMYLSFISYVNLMKSIDVPLGSDSRNSSNENFSNSLRIMLYMIHNELDMLNSKGQGNVYICKFKDTCTSACALKFSREYNEESHGTGCKVIGTTEPIGIRVSKIQIPHI